MVKNVKIDLLKEICDWYNFKVAIYDDGKVLCEGYFDEYEDEVFDSVDIALKGWLPTLLATNEDCFDYEEKIWNDYEIELIKNL